MATKKTPKGELVAICRLEFYRKQKSWKFWSQERIGKDSKKRTKTTNAKLNLTYNIESKEVDPSKAEPVDLEPDLDQAFVETETGTASESDEYTQPDKHAQPDENTQPEELLIHLKETHNTESENKPLQSLNPPNGPYSPKWSIQHWVERRRLRSPARTAPEDSNCPQPKRNPTEDAHYPTLEPNYDNQDIYYDRSSHYPDKGNYPITYLHEDFNYPPPPYHEPGPEGPSGEPESCNPRFGARVLYYNSNMHPGSDVILREPHMLDHGYEVPFGEPNMPSHGADVPYLESDVPPGFNVPLGGTDIHVGKASSWDIAGPSEYEGHCAGEGHYAREDAAWTPDWPDGAWCAEPAGGARREPAPGDWLPDDASAESLASVSSGEFVRGAARAPHSTQTDLLADADGDADGDGDGAAPAQLSGAALARALRRHSGALRQLLAEARRRQAPAGEPSCVDEVPVHEPGPEGPSLGSPPYPPFTDPFVAGSFNNRPDKRGHTEVGRGRGRLIGIGMGRPYRL